MLDTASRAGDAWRPWERAPDEHGHPEASAQTQPRMSMATVQVQPRRPMERRTVGALLRRIMTCRGALWTSSAPWQMIQKGSLKVRAAEAMMRRDDEARFDEFHGCEFGGRCESGGWITISTGAAQCNSADPAA